MSELDDITYCGLYCRLCSTKSRIPRTSTMLRNTLDQEGWLNFGEYVIPEFKSFWSGLEKLAGFETDCPDCRGGCGDPGCTIRKCATERGVELCPLCPDYPCENINVFARRYPNLIADGQRLKQIGPAAWRQEQELRGTTGFCYCDIRYP
ncbi:DUF3795 domain-containing protein [bacterium]|nr:DUF3795 domain-containing protein [bacterium]